MPDDWTKDLTPDEAQAALDALNGHKGPYTVNEAYELVQWKRALQARVEER